MHVVYVKQAAYLSEMLFTVTRYINNMIFFCVFSPSKIAVDYPLVLVSHCPWSSDLWLGDFRVSRCERWRNFANKHVIQSPSWLKGWKIDDSLHIYGYLLISCSFFFTTQHTARRCPKCKKKTQNDTRYTGHICFDLCILNFEECNSKM